MINRNAEVEWLLKAKPGHQIDSADLEELMDEKAYKKYLIQNEETSSSDDSDDSDSDHDKK